MKIRCIEVPKDWEESLTLNKVYNVEDSGDAEYWITTDDDDFFPVPKEWFEIVD